MPNLKFVSANAADVAAAATNGLNDAKAFKTARRASNFRDNLVFSLVPNVSDANWVRDENKKLEPGETPRWFPVFLTLVNGAKFDNLFLSTIINPMEDKEGNEQRAVGTFNKLVNEAYESSSNDAETLQKVIQRLAGRYLRIDRKHKFDGKYRKQSVLNIDIIDANGAVVDADGKPVQHVFDSEKAVYSA